MRQREQLLYTNALSWLLNLPQWDRIVYIHSIALFLFPHIVKTDFGRDRKVQLVKVAVELKTNFMAILTLDGHNSKK